MQLQHIKALQLRCGGGRLGELLDFIASRMMVVDPEARADSVDVREFIGRLRLG